MTMLTEKYKDIVTKNKITNKMERIIGRGMRFDLQTPRTELKRHQSPILSYIEPNSHIKYFINYILN